MCCAGTIAFVFWLVLGGFPTGRLYNRRVGTGMEQVPSRFQFTGQQLAPSPSNTNEQASKGTHIPLIGGQ